MNVAPTTPELGVVAIPSVELPRFLTLPSGEGCHEVIFLDDVVRLHLADFFPDCKVAGSYAVKVTRDAELYLEDEFSGDLVAMIRKSLKKRDRGLPTRFLYDAQMPAAVLHQLTAQLDLEDDDLVEGARYHNFSDFFGFPAPDHPHLRYPPLPPLAHPTLAAGPSLFSQVSARDHLISVPYHDIEPLLAFLDEAAADPAVERIAITLYRVASRSRVAQALIRAAQAGKQVTAFVEVKARFDEAANLDWAEAMSAAGVQVLYSMPGIKVHAKLLLIHRLEGRSLNLYAYLSTGNFNEKTARVYTDHGLFTAHPQLTREVDRVFDYLRRPEGRPTFDHLLVAPFHLRARFYARIDAEIAAAKAGRPAWIRAKMNNLEDPEMIAKLYEASQAGVPVQLIIRGICCLLPGLPGVSENIQVISIVDRFLEHARIYAFCNDGAPLVYLASADWMKRNLSRRIEVAFPVYDETHRQHLLDLLALQWRDNQRARVLDGTLANAYVPPAEPPVRAQADLYRAYQDAVAAAASV